MTEFMTGTVCEKEGAGGERHVFCVPFDKMDLEDLKKYNKAATDFTDS